MKKKGLLVFRQKPRVLWQYGVQGYNMSDDAVIRENEHATRDLYYGWKAGLEAAGYQVDYVDRVNFLVPEMLRRLAPRIYLVLVRVAASLPLLSHLSDTVYRTLIAWRVRLRGHDFFLYSGDWVSRPLIDWLRRHDCLSIEFHDTTPGIGRWPKTLARRPDVIVSGFNAADFPEIDLNTRFEEIILGVDPRPYGEPAYDKGSRPVDVCAVGSYNDGVFATRSRVIEGLLAHEEALIDLSVRIAGSASFSNLDQVLHLLARLQPPVYGRAYINLLESARTAVVVPSDDHLRAGDGLPLRVFQNAAAGCLQLVYDCSAIRKLFDDGQEVVLFKDVDELLEKLLYYLDHDDERVRIARQGRERFLRQYTAQTQIQDLFSRIME